MKKKALALCLVGILSLASGCTTLNSSHLNGPIHVSVEAPMKADIKVGEKISGTATIKKLFGFITTEGSNKFVDGINYGVPMDRFSSMLDTLESAKAAAAFNAINKSGADVIVGPQYVVEVEDYFVAKKITVTVTGYKGIINQIRSL